MRKNCVKEQNIGGADFLFIVMRNTFVTALVVCLSVVVASPASAQAPAGDAWKITVVPYLSTGATDSADLRRAGIKAYGLLPFPLEMPVEEAMHGNDERVSVENLGFGVRFLYDILRYVQ